MRIVSRLLDKFGYTAGCFGCAHKQAGFYDHRQHSLACRTCVYELMKNDVDELDKMERAEVRLGRMPPRGQQIRRGAAPMREPAAAAPSASHGGADARGLRAEAGAETEAAEQEARAPAAEACAEAEAVDDSAPEDGMPGFHQESDGEDDDERIVYEPTDPSEPRCPSGNSSSDSGGGRRSK